MFIDEYQLTFEKYYDKHFRVAFYITSGQSEKQKHTIYL